MTDTRSIVRWFVGAWAFVAIIVGAVVLSTEQLALHASINATHRAWADAFFAHFTHVADGWVPTLLALLILFLRDLRAFLMVGLSCGLSAIVVQTLKRGVFADHHRPLLFKDQLGDMAWVQGIEQHSYFSFPSGHSTAAFSMCLALAVVLGRKQLVLPLFGLACVLAYSRVHLSQHFTEDILAGSAVGTFTAVAVHQVLYRSRWSQAAWLRKRVLAGQNQ